MRKPPGRGLILLASAAAVFWPGAFIFALPGVMRLHWQQAFGADAGALGQIIFFILFGMAHFGAIFGLVFTACGFLSGPLGPWLSGHILDLTRGNFTVVFSYLGLLYLAAAGLVLTIRPADQRR